MPFNVDNFRSSLAFDGARPSLFEVSMACPRELLLPGADADITFKARAASLPGDSVSSIIVNYFGREIKVAGTRTFPEWSMTVINDEDFLIRNTMERWMSGLNSHVNNLRRPEFIRGVGGRSTAGAGLSSGYGTNILISQFSKAGPFAGAAGVPMSGRGSIKNYNLIGAFPTDVSAIDLNWGDGDSIEEFTITFAYQWWESVTPIETTDF